MKRRILCLEILAFLATWPVHAQVSNVTISPLESIPSRGGHSAGLVAALAPENDWLRIELANTTEDTLYLLDTYLEDDLVGLKYFHRVNAATKSSVVSYIPLLPYLTFLRSDRVVISERRVVVYGQMNYRFRAIFPATRLVVRLRREVLRSEEAVAEIDSAHFFDFMGSIDFEEVKEPRQVTAHQFIELAYYKDVSFRNDTTLFSTDYASYCKKASSFVRIAIPLEDVNK